MNSTLVTYKGNSIKLLNIYFLKYLSVTYYLGRVKHVAGINEIIKFKKNS